MLRFLVNAKTVRRGLETCVSILLGVLFVLHAGAAAGEVREEQLKAAYIFNFAKFVEWPVDAGGNDIQTVNVCAFDVKVLGGALAKLSGQSIKNKLLNVVFLKQEDNFSAQECHILYGDAKHAGDFGEIVERIPNASMLTIRETPDFKSSGVLTFRIEDNKVRFDVSTMEAKRRKLKLSSFLLDVSRKVN